MRDVCWVAAIRPHLLSALASRPDLSTALMDNLDEVAGNRHEEMRNFLAVSANSENRLDTFLELAPSLNLSFTASLSVVDFCRKKFFFLIIHKHHLCEFSGKYHKITNRNKSINDRKYFANIGCWC